MNEANSELVTQDPNGQPIKVEQGLGALGLVANVPTASWKVGTKLLTKPLFKTVKNAPSEIMNAISYSQTGNDVASKFKQGEILKRR